MSLRISNLCLCYCHNQESRSAQEANFDRIPLSLRIAFQALVIEDVQQYFSLPTTNILKSTLNTVKKKIKIVMHRFILFMVYMVTYVQFLPKLSVQKRRITQPLFGTTKVSFSTGFTRFRCILLSRSKDIISSLVIGRSKLSWPMILAL